MPTSASSHSPAHELARQERLLPFLLNPRSYPHRPKTVHLVQTHSSFVFIAPPLVYKIKKAVNFGFLDFTTLDRRRHFCEREVALNRRLAPKTYLDVVPISRQAGGYGFGRDGEVVEYAVKMRKLSERYFLDQRLARDAVSRADLTRIAVVLRNFYLSQRPTAAIEKWGQIARLRISTAENFRQSRAFVGTPLPVAAGASPAAHSRQKTGLERPLQSPSPTLSRTAFLTLRAYTAQFYRQHVQLFASRIRHRWIRDCHGDLHLEHIHLSPRTVQIYDCIEFNDRFRYVDVANDVAFLAMDLDYHGRPELARIFSDRVAKELKDDGLLRLLDFYKCYRAYVRGKVESLHSVAHASAGAERGAAAQRARRYFRLALQYSVAGSQPLVLVVMGRIASGKSALARALGAELGWTVLSSDIIRKNLAGLPLNKRSSAPTRRRLYSAAMTRKTYQILLRDAEAECQNGHGVILDATFGRPEQRASLAKRFARRGLRWQLLEAQVSDLAVRQRLSARATAGDEVSDARLDDYEILNLRYEAPTEVPAARKGTICTSGSIDQNVTKALKHLVARQLEL